MFSDNRENIKEIWLKRIGLLRSIKLVLSGYVVKLHLETDFCLWRVSICLLRMKSYTNIYANIFIFSVELILIVMERLKTIAWTKQEERLAQHSFSLGYKSLVIKFFPWL